MFLGHTRATARLEPGPLGRGKQKPSHKRPPLRRGRLPRPHRQRTGKQCAVQLHRARRYSRQWPRKGRAGDAALRTTPGGRLQGRTLLPLRPPFLKPNAPLPPATCAVKQRAIRTDQSPYPPTNHPGGGAALPIRNRMNQQNSANPRRQKTAVGPKQPAWESPVRLLGRI